MGSWVFHEPRAGCRGDRTSQGGRFMLRMAPGSWAIAAVLLSTVAAQAQDIRWRPDYASARKEAAATGKPMFLDFGTENCLWCRKLDATTFRDRAVVELLNDKFIPVKVDGERDERLTQSVGVQAFPTLVLVSAEGKIVGRHEGFTDVAKLMTLLRQAPAREAPKPAAAPRSPASELLVAARADHDAGRYLACLQKCDKLSATFAASTESGEARRLSMAITGDPDKWKRVTVQLECDFAAVKKDLDAALKR